MYNHRSSQYVLINTWFSAVDIIINDIREMHVTGVHQFDKQFGRWLMGIKNKSVNI